MAERNKLHHSPLGKTSPYVEQYAPELLFPIARAANRKLLGLDIQCDFYGVDIWTAYELSWLNQKGKPCVAIAQIEVPCDSLNLVESKSLKLYLNSFNQTRFASADQVLETMRADLVAVLGSDVIINLLSHQRWAAPAHASDYELLDELDLSINSYEVDPALLRLEEGSEPAPQLLVSHLLKSNCPVTGQPDWASLYIQCDGPRLDRAALLQYIVSYRRQADFHEHCIERIFTDLNRLCRWDALTVAARYLRRGGIDINPIRSTRADFQTIARTPRQ